MWSGAQALTCAGVLRSFTRSHLARIAHVYPEAYNIVVAYSKQRGDQAWDWLLRPGDEVKVGAAVAPPSPHTRRGRKRGAESLSDMAGQAVDPSRPSETRSVRRRLVFTDRVRDHVASHHTVRGHGGEGVLVRESVAIDSVGCVWRYRGGRAGVLAAAWLRGPCCSRQAMARGFRP